MIEASPLPAQPASGFRLSKSKFLSGLQCLKRLYLEIHAPELAEEPDEATQAILDMGTELGELARRRFSGGVLVASNHRQSTEALQRTRDLLQDESVGALFEAAFSFGDVLVRVDVLERVTPPGGEACWRLIEVKSSSRVKEVHVDDLAVQTFVLSGAGIQLSESCLMHVNTQYVYEGGEVDLDRLFTIQDVTAAVSAKLAGVEASLATMQAVLARPSAPAIDPGGHCHSPHDCPFWNHCTKEKPKRWIYFLPGDDRTFQALAQQGIELIDHIPAGFPLSIVQRRVKENVEWIGPRLKATLQTVRYPVHHLDFETYMSAVPRFHGTRPYQALPVQWSNHVETADGQVRHDEYLSMDAKDCREELTTALLQSLGREGSICVYSGYERSILERLAELFPSLRPALQEAIGRLWDLFLVIREHYYHPDFEGSFSIKSVLPAVIPTLGYDDLEIRDGNSAARQYCRMVFEETDLVERLRLREALLRYCARDTWAMVKLRAALYERAVAGRPMRTAGPWQDEGPVLSMKEKP